MAQTKYIFQLIILVVFTCSNLTAEESVEKLPPWVMVKVRTPVGDCGPYEEEREIQVRTVLNSKAGSSEPEWLMRKKPSLEKSTPWELGEKRIVTIKESGIMCWDGVAYECVPLSELAIDANQVNNLELCNGT